MIKLLHTIAWFIIAVTIGYVVYGSIYNKIDVNKTIFSTVFAVGILIVRYGIVLESPG